MDLKIKDVADLLNISETTIRRWVGEGKIPAYRIHHQYRFNRTEIEDWLVKQKLRASSEGSFEKPRTPLEVTSAQSHEKEKKLQKGGIKQYSLFRAIHTGGVYNHIKGNSKEEVICSTMKEIAQHLGLDADVMADLLLDREGLMPTALNNGIGVPHTRDFLMHAHRDAVAVVFPEEPIPYGALDGKPVHTLFFLFACDDKRHLHLLAKIAHLSSCPETLKLLQKRPTKEELLEHIRVWEGSIEKVQD